MEKETTKKEKQRIAILNKELEEAREVLKTVEKKNLVPLNFLQIEKFHEGRLLKVEHPEKGYCHVDTRQLYVNTFGEEMTEEEIKLFD